MRDHIPPTAVRRTAPLLLLVATFGIPRGTSGQALPPGEVPPPPGPSSGPEVGDWVSPVILPAETPPMLADRGAAVRLLQELFSGHAVVLALPGDERIRLTCGARPGPGDSAVRLWVYITERGEVGNTAIDRSSGDEETDLRMIRLVRALEFHPALYRWEPSPVWRTATLRLRPERCTA